MDAPARVAIQAFPSTNQPLPTVTDQRRSVGGAAIVMALPSTCTPCTAGTLLAFAMSHANVVSFPANAGWSPLKPVDMTGYEPASSSHPSLATQAANPLTSLP